MALPGQLRARSYNDHAELVGKLLHATGHEPNSTVLDTLRLIHERCPDLLFRDFCAGCALAITLAEAASPDRGHT
jgi:hypothetical protein